MGFESTEPVSGSERERIIEGFFERIDVIKSRIFARNPNIDKSLVGIGLSPYVNEDDRRELVSLHAEIGSLTQDAVRKLGEAEERRDESLRALDLYLEGGADDTSLRSTGVLSIEENRRARAEEKRLREAIERFDAAQSKDGRLSELMSECKVRITEHDQAHDFEIRLAEVDAAVTELLGEEGFPSSDVE